MSSEFEVSDGGILLPIPPVEEAKAVEPEFPVKEGWWYSRCDERYIKRHNDDFCRDALERLYIIVDAGQIGRFGSARVEEVERRKRLVGLINQLAVEIVGGVPESYEEFT